MIKKMFSVAVSLFFLASCKNGPKAEQSAATTDTAYVNWQARQRLDSFAAANELPVVAAAQTTAPAKRTPIRHTRSSAAGSTATSGGTAGTGTTAAATPAAKTGWSKTAKGAVIGGVAGAVGGALINKKNPAVGAVVGGVAGAGAGAVIGNVLDKKDGRH